MQFEKIQNNGPKVPELVMDSLLKAMEAGTIRVGEELPPERDLAEALGISRNSLRECLAILSFMGIVENRGNRKILVKYADRFRKARSLIDLSYSQDTFEDFMEFRRTNEREIARLACIRATARNFISEGHNIDDGFTVSRRAHSHSENHAKSKCKNDKFFHFGFLL